MFNEVISGDILELIPRAIFKKSLIEIPDQIHVEIDVRGQEVIPKIFR